jgi:NTE family protein
MINKSALVLSGGGSKGAFSIGVIKFLKEKLDIRFDIVSGTSTGALIAPFVITNKLDVVESVYTNVTNKDIISPISISNILKGYLYDTKGLKKLIDKHVTDEIYQFIMNSETTMITTSVCLQTGKLTYFNNKKYDHNNDKDVYKFVSLAEMRSAILASSNQPLLMPPVSIFTKQYVDGGIREFSPVEIAISFGAKKILVLVTTPDDFGEIDVKLVKLKDMLLRTIDILTKDVSLNDLKTPLIINSFVKHINNVRESLVVRFPEFKKEIDEILTSNSPIKEKDLIDFEIIRPDVYLGAGLEFDPKIMKTQIELGFFYC